MIKFIKNLSSSYTRLIFFIISILVFGITAINNLNILIFNATSNDECAWREVPGSFDKLFITDIIPGGVADVAGLKNGDILLKLNGESYNTSSLETNPMNIVNPVKRGEHVIYLIEREGKQFELSVEMRKIINYSTLAYLLLGLGFIFVGLVVVLTHPEGFIQKLFGIYALTAMMYFTTIAVLFKDIEFLIIPMNIINGTAKVFGTAVFLIFFFYFPVKLKFRHTKILFWLIVILNSLVYYYLFRAKTPIPAIIYFGAYFPIFMFFSGLGVFVYSYFHIKDKSRRKQLRPVLYGVLISFSSFTYISILGRINPFVIFLNPMLTLPCLLMLFLPGAFGYSIFRYRLMDTEVLFKKGIIYSIVTIVLALFYFSMVFGIGNVIGKLFQHSDNNALMIISLVVIAFLFDPFKSKVQQWVDKVFYRDKNEYREALLEFSRVIPMQTNSKELLNSLVNTISNTMHIAKAAGVLISENNEQMCFSKNVSDELCRYSSEPKGILNLLNKIREPINTTLLRDDRHFYDISDEEIQKIEHSDFQLIVPMIVKDKVIGFINTGRKLSEQPYTDQDVQVLKTVASQAAIAVENSRLYEKEKALYKVQEEMNLAYSIQSNWIPKKAPEIKGFDIAGYSKPARTVGGDYFDFIKIDENKTAICVGDVSGKGLPAALMMANLQAIIRSQVLSNFDPKTCLNNTNRIIFDGSRNDMFITLFVSILDSGNKKFAFANAGHNFPILYKANGEISEIESSNLVLGIYEFLNYEGYEHIFSPGDVLLLYTDGITDASDNTTMYGVQMLKEVLKSNIKLNAKELIEKIIENVNSYSTSEQYDDMTLVAIKCNE